MIIDFQGHVGEFITPDAAEDFIQVFFELVQVGES